MYYIRVVGKCNNIKLSVGYSKGGFNWFDGSHINRGFYLSLTPINKQVHKTREGFEYTTEMSSLGAGYKIATKPIARKSEKAFREAIEELKTKENLIKQALYKILDEFDLMLAHPNDYNIKWEEFSYKEC